MSTTTQRPTPETDASDTIPYMDGDELTWWVKKDFARKLERERDEAREALSGRTVSCSQCNEAARQLEAMREAIKNIYYLTEGYADGAPDASAHDKLCNEIADKLKPLIKP